MFAYLEVLLIVREDLTFLGRNCRIVPLDGPTGWLYVVPMLSGIENVRLLEYWHKSWEPVFQDAHAETEGVHKACCQRSRVSSMTVAQHTLETCDKFHTHWVGLVALMLTHVSYFLLINVLDHG